MLASSAKTASSMKWILSSSLTFHFTAMAAWMFKTKSGNFPGYTCEGSNSKEAGDGGFNPHCPLLFKVRFYLQAIDVSGR
jgi:hypothetical protein